MEPDSLHISCAKLISESYSAEPTQQKEPDLLRISCAKLNGESFELILPQDAKVRDVKATLKETYGLVPHDITLVRDDVLLRDNECSLGDMGIFNAEVLTILSLPSQIQIRIEEDVKADLKLDGNFNDELDRIFKEDLAIDGSLPRKLDVLGALYLTPLESIADLTSVKLNPKHPKFKYKVHPNLDKTAFVEHNLKLRAGKSFETHREIVVEKWKLDDLEGYCIPLLSRCVVSRPSVTNKAEAACGISVMIAYDLVDDIEDLCLEDFTLALPCPSHGSPDIKVVSSGQAIYDSEKQTIVWQIPRVEKNMNHSGYVVFATTANVASLLPFSITVVRSGYCFNPIDVLACDNLGTKEHLIYSMNKKTKYCLTFDA